MSATSFIVKNTGHLWNAHQAGKFDYLNELRSRGIWTDELLTRAERHQLLGQHRRIDIAKPGEKLTRLPAQIIQQRGADGVVREKKTGTITAEYLAQLDELEDQGYQIYQRVRVVGFKQLDPNHGYILAGEHGAVTPQSWLTRLRAQELGWTAALHAAAGMPILSRGSHGGLHLLERRNQTDRRAIRRNRRYQ